MTRLYHENQARRCEREADACRRVERYPLHLSADDWVRRLKNADELDRLALWHWDQARRAS